MMVEVLKKSSKNGLFYSGTELTENHLRKSRIRSQRLQRHVALHFSTPEQCAEKYKFLKNSPQDHKFLRHNSYQFEFSQNLHFPLTLPFAFWPNGILKNDMHSHPPRQGKV
jgi:hypothetical protein